MKKILKENKEWRIILITPDDNQTFVNDFYSRKSARYRVTLDTVARLEKRKWFFGSYWLLEELTNITSVVQGWIDEHFRDGSRVVG